MCSQQISAFTRFTRHGPYQIMWMVSMSPPSTQPSLTTEELSNLHKSLRHKAYRVPTFVPNRHTERFQVAIETYRKMHLLGCTGFFRNNWRDKLYLLPLVAKSRGISSRGYHGPKTFQKVRVRSNRRANKRNASFCKQARLGIALPNHK